MLNTPNRCASCLSQAGEARPSWEVADTGACGSCGTIGDVFDLELLQIYRQARISDRVVYVAFPRLRIREAGEPPAFSLDEVQRLVKEWRHA